MLHLLCGRMTIRHGSNGRVPSLIFTSPRSQAPVQLFPAVQNGRPGGVGQELSRLSIRRAGQQIAEFNGREPRRQPWDGREYSAGTEEHSSCHLLERASIIRDDKSTENGNPSGFHSHTSPEFIHQGRARPFETSADLPVVSSRPPNHASASDTELLRLRQSSMLGRCRLPC